MHEEKEVKEPEIPNDLEEEVKDWTGKFHPSIREYIQSTAYHFADWQKEQDNVISRQAEVEIIKTQQMCYEKGKADMKRLMMKEAVEGEVEDVGVNYIDLTDFDAEKLGLVEGDKVRIIVCKKED